MDFLTVANQMISLFIIMVVGYVMYRVKIIDDAATVRYTRLVLNISLPAQIITSFVENRGVVPNGVVLSVFGISFVVYAIAAVVGAVFVFVTRAPKEERGTYLFMCLFGNVGFMGFPVIVTIFGDGALIYAVIFNVIFNILVYSLGITLIGGGKGGYKFSPKLLLNIPFIAALVSVLLFFAGVSLPRVLVTSMDYLGNLTTPVAMLVLGATIASMPVKELFDDWRVYLFTVFRLGVIPLATMAVLRMFSLTTPEIAGIMIVLAAMPVATNTTMLAIEYGGNMRLASKGIFFSTILSVITIPAAAMFC